MDDGRRRLVVDVGAGFAAIAASAVAVWGWSLTPSIRPCYGPPPSRLPAVAVSVVALAIAVGAGIGLRSRGGSRLHGLVGVLAAVAASWAIVSLFVMLATPGGCGD